MEEEITEITPKKIKKSPFVAMAILLVFTVLGVLLLLGRALDTDRFFFSFEWNICALPFMFAFPIYAAVEYINMSVNGKENNALLGIPQQKHDRTAAIGFWVGLAGVLVGSTMLFVFSKDPATSILCSTAITLPGLLAYLGSSLYYAVKGEEKTSAVVTLLVYIVVAVVIELVGALGVANLGMPWALAFLGFPLLCVCMIFVGRDEDVPS